LLEGVPVVSFKEMLIVGFSESYSIFYQALSFCYSAAYHNFPPESKNVSKLLREEGYEPE